MQDGDNIPNEFVCPISLEIMRDPVICKDGHTYERKAILEWLEKNNVSPLTRTPISKQDLIPNIALRNTIYQQYPHLIAERGEKDEEVKKEKIKVQMDATKYEEKTLVHISVKTEEINKEKRKPAVFICVLDVSGSMGTEIALKEGSHGFSRIDLVKHSMNSIIHLLSENDYIAIIPFSNKAEVLLTLTKMDATGKQVALMQVDELEPDDSTNIWDGIRVGLELSKDPICMLNDNVSLLLLTDGEPNINPPRGIVPTLERFISSNPLKCTIHTFGFGYQLDSAMLNKIASIGTGSYSYIPDCTMVGTVFVNFVSNALSTFIPRASIRLSPLNNAKITKIYGFPKRVSESGEIVEIGSLLYGQSRDLIIELEIDSPDAKPYLSATIESFNDDDLQVEAELTTIYPENQCEIFVQYARSLFIERVQILLDTFGQSLVGSAAIQAVNDLIHEIQSVAPSNDQRVIDLLRDIKSDNENEGGQVFQAISREDWFNKWGKHYLPSLVRSHTLQQCNNFKDPGIQHYGGKVFHELQNIADEIFCTLTPPEPYQLRKAKQHKVEEIPKWQPVVDMRNYYNVHGGCFNGDALIRLRGDQMKKVNELKKFDEVKTAQGYARVMCLVSTPVTNRKVGIDMVDINGLKITPWHPICLDGKWQFPNDVLKSSKTVIDRVYNLVLDSGHSVFLNDVEVITLAHGNQVDPVLRHPYFATDRVIEDLKKLRGWEDGYVVLHEKSFVRDPNTLLVSSLSAE